MSAVLPVLPVWDRRLRPLHDLRISVTDRCNFRCPYCMPRAAFAKNHRFLPRAAILSFEEMTRVARAATSLGVRKIRLTGGEPLLRTDLPKLVSMLSTIPELDIALTTNGSLLSQFARPLADAGLRRVTVSLDSLDPDMFRKMSDTEVPVTDVLAGIDAAIAAGLGPVKVNTVVQRGVNDSGIEALARRFQGTGVTVRFIEYMDVGSTNGWSRSSVVPAPEMVARIDAVSPLEPLAPARAGDVARRFRYRDGSGEVGVIASVTQPFCGDCSRARLSADGHLYTCLFATRGTDLRPVLRASPENAALRELLASVWSDRDDRYSELRATTPPTPKIEMSYIGG